MSTDDEMGFDSGRVVKAHAAVAPDRSAVRRYQDVVVGRRSLRALVYYEWCMWLKRVPGALGLFLRSAFWPRLFGSCGKGVVFGENITLRHPHRVHLGNRIILGDGCILDARHDAADQAVTLGDDVVLSNDVMIQCKSGRIEFGPRCGIGPHTIVQSAGPCPVSVGADVLMGPRCYLVGGGNYKTDRVDIPISQQGHDWDSGVRVEDDVWLGANVTVLGGVTIGSGSVAAAGSVVVKSIPGHAVCMGVPARVMRMRGARREDKAIQDTDHESRS